MAVLDDFNLDLKDCISYGSDGAANVAGCNNSGNYFIYIIFQLLNSYLKKHLDLVGLVSSWVSSNNHSNFTPISSPCGGDLTLG